MRRKMAWLICLLFLGGAICFSGRAGAQSRATAPATIEGRITVVEAINRSVEATPIRNRAVYLFNLGQSKPLQELQHRCRKAPAKPGGDAGTAFAAYNACNSNLGEAVKLVPQLPAVAMTKTDNDGHYKFENVPPAQRYQVVMVMMEDGDPIVIVGLTTKLKAEQRLTIDLRENDPWTNADPL